MKMKSLSRRVVITGGGSGIGLIMAKRFAQNGDQVAVCDIDSKRIKEINNLPLNILAIPADVSIPSDMETFKEMITSEFGGVDIMISNAGTAGSAGPIETQAFSKWKQCLNTNLDGAFLSCRWAAETMKTNKSGLILLISSTSGLFGVPNRSPYVTAKWGLIGLAKSLAIELGPSGIRVNAICPGAVQGDRMNHVLEIESKATGRSPSDIAKNFSMGVSLRRFVTPEDVADMAIFLASDAAKQINGQAIAVDGNTERMV